MDNTTVDDTDEVLDHEQQSDEEKRCPTCGQINSRKPLIECTQCGSHYHRSCVRITRYQANQIPRYKCAPCRNVTAPNLEPSRDVNQTTPEFDLLHHLMTCKSNLSLIGNIPRGARITAADALNDLINDVVRSNTSLSWAKLLCFAYHGLQKPKKEKPTPNSPSLVTKLKNQISVFMNSNFPPDRFPFEPRRRNARPKPKEEVLKNRVDAKFAENDLRGAIRELSSDDALSPDTS